MKKAKKFIVGALTSASGVIGANAILFGAIDLISYSEMMKAEFIAVALLGSAVALSKLIKD